MLLNSGQEVFAPEDDDSIIRLASNTGAGLHRAGAPGPSKFSQARIGREASTIGNKHSGSKLGSSKLGSGPQRAGAHKSARPESRDEALARRRAAAAALGV